MIEFLISGAVIALGVIIYNAWNGDSTDAAKREQTNKAGEQGCMWLFILIGGIILVWILSSVFS